MNQRWCLSRRRRSECERASTSERSERGSERSERHMESLLRMECSDMRASTPAAVTVLGSYTET
jgi:hypothetical protein